MRPAEIVLHGITLACCAALGAGVWSLSRREVPAYPPPAVSEADLQALSREVATLQREIGDLRNTLDARAEPRDEPRPPAAVAESRPAPEPIPSAVVLALEDPKVQERIQAVVDARLDREEKDREERMRERGRELAQERRQAFEEKAGLNGTQKDLFGRLVDETLAHLDAVRRQVRDRTITRDQGREDLKRWHAEMDLRVRSALTAEQFKQYQAWSQPLREMNPRRGGMGEGVRGRRSDRENPVP